MGGNGKNGNGNTSKATKTNVTSKQDMKLRNSSIDNDLIAAISDNEDDESTTISITVADLRTIIKDEMTLQLGKLSSVFAERLDFKEGELKLQIDSLTNEVKSLRKSMDSSNKSMDKLNQQLFHSSASLKSSLEKNIENSKHHPTGDGIPLENVHKVVVDAVKETEMREVKKLNLVFFNIVEPVDGTVEQRKQVDSNKLSGIQDAISTDVRVISFKRIGTKLKDKPRPLIVNFKDFNDKMSVLKAAKNLKNLAKENSLSKVSIQPDLTKQQQEEGKRLYVELQKRREDGEDVIIRSGKIIQRDQHPQRDQQSSQASHSQQR
jgi:hypothetical protein